MGLIALSPSSFRWVWLLLVASTALAGPIDDDPKPKSSGSKKTSTSKSKTSDKAKSKANDAPKTPEEQKQAEEQARRKDEALKVAEAYLVLLDKGKFGEGWAAMTADVRKGITRRKMVDALGKTRGTYAPLQARKLNRIQMRATEYANKFDEAWVYADFQTVDGETASEVIVVVLEGGKDWAVNAYYINPDPSKLPKPPAEEPEQAPTAAPK